MLRNYAGLWSVIVLALVFGLVSSRPKNPIVIFWIPPLLALIAGVVFHYGRESADRLAPWVPAVFIVLAGSRSYAFGRFARMIRERVSSR